MLNHTATFVHGTNRVEGVTVAEVDGTRKPLSGSDRTIECDTLILSVGLIPENELSEVAGAVLDPSTGGPVVDEDMQTTVPGIFACGNVVQVQDLVDHVTAMGELAGKSAAEYAKHRLTPLRNRVALRTGLNVRNVVPQVISGEKTVRLQIRVDKPLKNATVSVGGFSCRSAL
jgi:thioredoxin reductase